MEDRLSAKIVSTAWPAVLEMALYMLIGLADVAFVGRIGAVHLAAVSLGAEVFWGIILTLTNLGIGATVLTAQYTGARRFQEINRLAAQVLVMAFSLGLITGVAGWFLSPSIIAFFAVEDAVAAIAVQYLRATFAAAPLALCLYIGNGIFRGNGNTRVPMTIALLVNIVNILASYTLVFGRFGFPQLGGLGAGIAASSAHFVGFLLMLSAMLSGRWGVRLNLRELLPVRGQVISRMFTLGFPTGLEEFFRNASTVASSLILVHLGTQAFASHQIAIAVESLSFMPGHGIAIAATAVVGQALGARKPELARRAAIMSFQFAAFIMGLAAVVFYLCPGFLAGLFTHDKSLLTTAGILIQIAALEQIPIAAEMVFAGALRGTGDTRTPMLVSLIATWFFRIPLLWVMVKVLHLQLYQIWFLFVADWCLRAIAILFIILRVKWENIVPVNHQSC
ncbi:MAG: MATE family efflux transporter [Syntrophomonadaceae bacterium]|nr:MATE family efflux transporter [Syntrophomonadaceae bacterium]